MFKRVLIVHGTGGRPSGNWFPWLSREVEKLGLTCLAPQFPLFAEQNLDNWLKVLHAEAGALTEEDVLIGHSIGAAFVLRVLERQSTAVGACFLAAGFARPLGNPDFDPYNATFVEPPFQWDQIRRACANIFLYSGADDPYVPSALGAELKDRLAGQSTVIAGGGHLNASSGYFEFPLLLADLKKALADSR